MLHGMLRETWAFKEILQEGRQEGRQEGLQEGLQKEVADLRQILLVVAEARSPRLLSLAQGLSSTLQDPEALKRVIFNVSRAKTDEEAQAALLEDVAEGKN